MITMEAEDGGGATGTCVVTVTAGDPIKVTGITADPPTMTLAVGEMKPLGYTITPSNATNTGTVWSSSNHNIASFNSSGNVIGVGIGTATITMVAEDGGGAVATCAVTVN